MKNVIMIIGLLLGITSCEHAYDYSYLVTNKSDVEIDVYVKTFRIDSVFIIPKDSTQLLLITDHGIEGSKGPYDRRVTGDLDKFEVTKNDTLKSKRDYLKNDAWTFKKGKYSTIVTDDEFK